MENNLQNPPKWVLTLLEWATPESHKEVIMGDMIEAYRIRLNKFGNVKATFLFVMESFGFLRKNFSGTNKNKKSMGGANLFI